jgi:bacterioferritin-associated ferredoxin
MYVCICNAVTDTMIRDAAAEGARSLADLTRRTGCAGTCGSCSDLAEQVLREARGKRSARPFAVPMVAQAA